MASIAEIPPEQWRGEIGYLSLISPTVHRRSLEMTARQAAVAAEAILASSAVSPEVARLQGMALAGVFQIAFAECGWRTRDRQTPLQVSEELTAIMAAVLGELERWFDA